MEVGIIKGAQVIQSNLGCNLNKTPGSSPSMHFGHRGVIITVGNSTVPSNVLKRRHKVGRVLTVVRWIDHSGNDVWCRRPASDQAPGRLDAISKAMSCDDSGNVSDERVRHHTIANIQAVSRLPQMRSARRLIRDEDAITDLGKLRPLLVERLLR